MELFILRFVRQIMLTERKMAAVLFPAPHFQLLQKSSLVETLLLIPHSMLIKREWRSCTYIKWFSRQGWNLCSFASNDLNPFCPHIKTSPEWLWVVSKCKCGISKQIHWKSHMGFMWLHCSSHSWVHLLWWTFHGVTCQVLTWRFCTVLLLLFPLLVLKQMGPQSRFPLKMEYVVHHFKAGKRITDNGQ